VSEESSSDKITRAQIFVGATFTIALFLNDDEIDTI